MPWKKGESGNPRGKKPQALAVSTVIRQLGGPDGRLYVQTLHSIAMKADTDARAAMSALVVLLERGWGKTPETTVHIDAAALRDLSDADLEAALRVAEKLSGG